MSAATGLALTVAWPLALTVLQICMAGRRLGLGPLWLSAPLPALATALLVPDGTLTLSWWLLGGFWELNAMRSGVLGFTALLWGLAGLYARGYLAPLLASARAGDTVAERRVRLFCVLWLVTLSGNLLLLVAEDIASFYTGFTLMSFAAYGLVVHGNTRAAHRGARAYLLMAVLGEGAILGGLLWSAGQAEALLLGELRAVLAEAPHATAMATLLWLGFGVKAGVVLLHVWLPLAHPVAPTPASAVLSGAMVKAGLVGWWQTLPLGLQSLPALGWAMLLTGLAGAFAAALYGVTQRLPKAVLAYSSVSQLGMMGALLGAGLIEPELWSSLAPAVVLFAAHHSLNKGALFLGVGIVEHPPRLSPWLIWTLLSVPGISLTGALASGMSAKWVFKSALYEQGWQPLITALSWAAVGTTLLIARTLWRERALWREACLEKAEPAPPSMLLAWGACVVLAALVPWWLRLPAGLPGMPPLGEWGGLLWPLGVGVALALGVMQVVARSRVWHARAETVTRLPAGDLWTGYARLARRLTKSGQSGIVRLTCVPQWLACAVSRWLRSIAGYILPRLDDVENGLQRWGLALMLILALSLGWVLLG